MNFKDIKKFTPDGTYGVDSLLNDLPWQIERYVSEYGLQLNPDFQRGCVWTTAQQVAFVEYMLRGGITTPIRLNHPGWMTTWEGDFVCVDGLQRLTALLKFLNNEIPAFGTYLKDFEGRMPMHSIRILINDLPTKKEVLQWYYDLNAGGTPHTVVLLS